jgi:OmcA/MtrC family decaheme c-type cytochrome
MRRISLALALVGAVAVTGCSGGTSPAAKTGTGVAKGVVGQYYFVNIFTVPVGGRIASVTAGGVEDGKINCGEGAAPLVCGVLNSDGFHQTSYAWGDTVRLKALSATGKAFIGWAGDCGGVGTCSLDTVASGADKTVAAIFGAPGTGHGNFTDPAIHGPEYTKFVTGQDGALKCTQCHGSDLLGQSIAPSCASCHPAPSANSLVRPATGLNFSITSITSTSTGIVVQFTVKDDGGKNIDLTGADGKNTSFVPRFGLASFSRNATTGIVGPYLVRTAGDATSGGPGVLTPPAVGAAASPTTGQLTGTPGTYTYAFPPVVTFDPARSADTHTLWIQGSRQENVAASSTKSLTVRNYQFNFIPGAIDVPVTAQAPNKREVVSAAACIACHDDFKAKGLLTGGVFHGGGRVDGTYCAVCHNPANTRTQEGTLHGVWRGSAGQFIHNIHASAQMGMPASEMFSGISAATYPQPVMNCTACHAASAAQGAQWKTRPTIEACGSCHVNYPYPHNQNSTGACEGCHTPDGVEWVHVPVVPKDYTNSLEPGTGVASNFGTNASAIQGAGQVIPGASWITAVIQSITTTSANRPVVTFKLQKNSVTYVWNGTGMAPSTVTTDVVFNAPPAAPDASAELMADYIGTVGVYVVFSLPQDGINAPADFNVAVSSNVKLAWMNVAGTGSDATTLSGPVGGYYAITFPNLLIPANAVNLTGGIGYAYELPGTQPLAQISVGGSAWSNNMYKAVNAPVTTGTVFGQNCSPSTPCALKTGGLIAPIPNVWKGAATPRRSIVDNAKCNGCHAVLGVGPTFHVGQRNDAPTCSFCHNPNQNKAGWSSNASTFVHAIHGAGKRTVDYGWTAACPSGSTWNATNAQCEDNTTHAKVKAGFAEVEYPQSPAHCGACHTNDTGSYAFQGVPVGNLLWSTVASGTMGAATAPAQSPYVELGKNYGAGFAVTMGASGGAPTITAAAATTLVTSPITAACFSCHDSTGARSHMTAMGGSLYKARSAVSTTLDAETCLDCHGVGKGFDIVLMHR